MDIQAGGGSVAHEGSPERPADAPPAATKHLSGIEDHSLSGIEDHSPAACAKVLTEAASSASNASQVESRN